MFFLFFLSNSHSLTRLICIYLCELHLCRSLSAVTWCDLPLSRWDAVWFDLFRCLSQALLHEIVMWFFACSTSVLIGTFEAYAWKFEVYVSFRDCERRGDDDVWRKRQVSQAHFTFFFFYTTIHCDYSSECQTAFVWSVDLQQCLCLSVSVFCFQPWRRWVRCLLLLNLSHTFFKNLFLFTVHSWVEKSETSS